jgi:hypothetical protein
MQLPTAIHLIRSLRFTPPVSLVISQETTCEPGGIRTHDQGIKSPLLYR